MDLLNEVFLEKKALGETSVLHDGEIKAFFIGEISSKK